MKKLNVLDYDYMELVTLLRKKGVDAFDDWTRILINMRLACFFISEEGQRCEVIEIELRKMLNRKIFNTQATVETTIDRIYGDIFPIKMEHP